MKLHRKYRMVRSFALTMSLVMLIQLIAPATAYALTSGPTQPEVQAFEPMGTTDMVDLFTGDFTYNIPLFELPGPSGGYPFNLAYHSGIGMDDEASWVGLGWSLNPGVITRSMRGLPDEFKGDEVKKTVDMKPNRTYGLGAGAGVEIFGLANLNLGLTLYRNNYRGFGYKIDAGLQFDFDNQSGLAGKVGLGLSLDSQEGVGVNPSFNISDKKEGVTKSFNIGIGYNSRRGMTDLSLSAGRDKATRLKNTSRRRKLKMGGNAGISFANSSYTPSVANPSHGTTADILIKTGGSLFAVFGNLYMSGFFNESHLKHRGDEQAFAGYGYWNLSEAGEDGLRDYNREKDGAVQRETPNLGIPSLTYDYYSISGQGAGGMFRPYRNQNHIISDQRSVSTMASISGGTDVGPVPHPHFGVNGAISGSKTVSGAWDADNEFRFPYEDESEEPDYEEVYFKTNGEYTTDPSSDLDYLLGEDPVAIELKRRAILIECKATDQLVDNAGQKITVGLPADQSREPRIQVPTHVSNDDLGGNNEVLGEYALSYYDTTDNIYDEAQTPFGRADKPGHHPAGFTSLNSEGQRYVYGLPAYNSKQVEATFSVEAELPCTHKVSYSGDYDAEGTNHFLDRTELPEYAHSYLLTSVLGPDYVDVDGIPGPSEGDVGYWVKFDYVKAADEYKWRAPFSRANKDQAIMSDYTDDRGSYLYGEKEIWYLATVQTKTHIAEFHISKRDDSRGALTELQNSNTLGDSTYRLDNIQIFSRKDRFPDGNYSSTATPLQTVHFRYNYSLCQGLPNSDGSNGSDGKLTLDSLWFTYQSSTRGSLSPYVFNYDGANPDYNDLGNDRWGNYKPPVSDSCGNFWNSYVPQYDPSMTDSAFHELANERASAWHLTSINLPSGATIAVDYETDDYGYVQNRRAMQMTPIESLTSTSGTNTIDHIKEAGDDKRRIYFDLEYPLYSSQTTELQEYTDGIKEAYFKVKIKTRKASEVFEDFVSGYAPVKGIHFDLTSINGAGKCTRAYVVLDYLRYGNKTIKYHPFSVAAWQYLRSTNPALLKQPNLPLPDNGTMSLYNKILAVASLATVANDLVAMFTGVFKYCHLRDFGKKIDLDYSWIRLNSPDKIKYGGGVRVKQISMTDGWDNSTSGESGSEYGNVYEYTIDENGETISSGVAAYEPMVGGDENPLRKAKMYMDNVPLAQDFPLFFEYPVNESYYPAPMVGYRKVTVKSLSTHQAISGTINGDPVTTGATVHEFYTAKDYPVTTGETNIDMKAMPTLTIPLGPFGAVSTNNTYASQGYSVILNDMHGKPKRISNYRQDINSRILYNSAISSVEYEYFDATTWDPSAGQNVSKLKNNLPTLVFDVDENDLTRSKIENRLIGQDYEFVADMRSVNTLSIRGGLSYNIDFIFLINPFLLPPIIPLPPISTIWPNLGLSSTLVRTAVTNKIIHRAGILKKVTAMTEGSTVTTENIYFDALTGRPLLTKVNNAWEDPIYKYEYPAHWAYEQMGAAYKNIGLRMEDVSFSAWSGNGDYAEATAGISPDVAELLVPGDEFIAWTGSTGQKAVFLGDFDGDLVFNFEDNSVPGSATDLLLTRSGRRNHLSQNVQEITALKDPTRDRAYYGCYRDLEFPGTVIDSIDTIQVVAPCVENLLELIAEIFPVANNESLQLGQWPYSQYSDFCVSCPDSAMALKLPSADSTIIRFGTYIDPCCEIGFMSSTDTLLAPTSLDSVFNPQYVGTYPGTILPLASVYSGIQVSYYEKGNPTPGTAYLFYYEHPTNGNGCGQFTVDRYVTYLTNSSGDYTLLDTIFSIDSVLSAVATTFSDGWSQDFKSLQFRNNAVSKLQDLRDQHPFYTGERGIWRPWQSYVYRADRRQSADVNLREDGTFGNVPIFNFNGLVFTACGQEWVRTNEVVRYEPGGQECENRNVLDVYSAALFGYGGGIPVAVASNARQHELAFESFEEYGDGATVDQFGVSRGNLDIYNSYQSVASNDPYQVLVPEWLIAGENTTAITSTPYPVGFGSSTRDKADVRSDGSVFNPSVNFANGRDISSVANHGGHAQYVLSRAPDLHGKASGTVFAGKVQLDQPLAFQTSSTVLNRVSFTDDKAHTGSMCMELEGIVIFPQNRFRPEPGTTYVLSAWVSRDSVNQYTYRQNLPAEPQRIGMKISYLDSAGTVISSSLLYEPVGKNVEGWQKIEAEFTAPAHTERISLKLQSGQDKNGNNIPAYFDDIRMNPLTSNMKSYVYDPDNLRLQAVLDPNNYATRYHYDEQGQLFLVKKETERGIKTIQESRTFVRE